MSPAAFLRDRALSVAVAIVCAIAIGSVVAVLGAGPDASVLAACIVLACAAFALTGATRVVARFTAISNRWWETATAPITQRRS